MFFVNIINLVHEILKTKFLYVDCKESEIKKKEQLTVNALRTCSGAIVFLFSLLQISLASEETRWMNSTGDYWVRQSSIGTVPTQHSRIKSRVSVEHLMSSGSNSFIILDMVAGSNVDKVAIARYYCAKKIPLGRDRLSSLSILKLLMYISLRFVVQYCILKVE